MKKRLTFPSSYLLLLPILSWFGNALYAVGEFAGWLKEYSPALVAVALISYVILHGRRRYGNRVLTRFVVIVFSFAWVFESLSLITGFPFGNYHYTEIMAPYLWRVPIFVLPAYTLMGYASWSLATLLCGTRSAQLDRVGTFVVPLVAASAMVFWDLSMDPLRATVEGRWIWLDSGAHMGVPFSNYAGWFGVTWLMFQVFALYLGTLPAKSLPSPPSKTAYWLSMPLIYVTFSVEYLLNPFVGKLGEQMVMVQGNLVSVQSLYIETAIYCLLTMIPLAIMGVFSVFRNSKNELDHTVPQSVSAIIRKGQ